LSCFSKGTSFSGKRQPFSEAFTHPGLLWRTWNCRKLDHRHDDKSIRFGGN
jgi:hypothetical protein